MRSLLGLVLPDISKAGALGSFVMPTKDEVIFT